MSKCNCGFEVEEGCEGCGEVIEEWTEENDEGEIIDNGWYHCGENGRLCDECSSKTNKTSEDNNA